MLYLPPYLYRQLPKRGIDYLALGRCLVCSVQYPPYARDEHTILLFVAEVYNG